MNASDTEKIRRLEEDAEALRTENEKLFGYSDADRRKDRKKELKRKLKRIFRFFFRKKIRKKRS